MKVGVFVDGGRRSERAADVKERETQSICERGRGSRLKAWKCKKGELWWRVCLEIRPGQECVRGCCSVYLPGPGDTSDTDISQQPPCCPEPLPLIREPIYTHTHTISLSFPSLGHATGSVFAWADQECQNHMTPTGLLKLSWCYVTILCRPRLLMCTAGFQDSSPSARDCCPSIILAVSWAL